MSKLDDILALDRGDDPELPRVIGEVVTFDIDGGSIAHIGALAIWRLDVNAPATPERARQLRYIGVPFVVSDDEDALCRLVLKVVQS